VAREAAQHAFPGKKITRLANLEAAVQGEPANSSQLLVLADANAAAVAGATQANDAGGLPRWAVVVLGRQSPEFADTVPPADWNPPLLARAFRSALLQHELLCENLRLRGDLKTVARRVTHDLRTPLGCIQTTSFLLKDLDAASLNEMAGVIQQSSVEIAQLIDRVSFVLRASADPSTPGPVGMGALVAGVLRQLEGEIKAAGAVVTQPPSWPTVTGVAPWLQVIWWNLLSNAVRYGGPAARIRLAWKTDSSGWRFSVTDRGPGVAPDRVAGLFSAFDQLHGMQTPGLGLSLTHRLVTLQKGTCGYETASKGGASFYFTLPATEAAE
jgi:signal transduction histidine kinase